VTFIYFLRSYKNSYLLKYERIKNFFQIIYVAITNNQFSVLYNDKMTWQTRKY